MRLAVRLFGCAWVIALFGEGNPVAGQKVIVVKVPISAIQYGPQNCTVDSTTSNAKDDSLAIVVQRTAPDTGGAASPSDLLVRKGPQLVSVIQAGSPRTAAKVSLADFRGQVVTVTTASNQYVCHAALPTAPPTTPGAARTPAQMAYGGGFTVQTGVEFASGNGFSSQQTRIPVSARLDVPFPNSGRIGRIRFRPSLSLGAEFTSAAKSVIRTECSGFVRRRLTADERETARLPDRPTNFPRGRCTPAVIRDDTTVAFYYERLDSVGFGTTDMVWRSTLAARFEGEVVPDSRVYWGPVILASVETVPTGSLGRLAQTYRGGLNLRQLATDGTESFSLAVLVGNGHEYSEEVLSPDPQDLSRRVRIDTSRPTGATTVRLFFQPVQGFYLRGIGEFNWGAQGDFASVALVRTLDVGALLRVFGLGGGT